MLRILLCDDDPSFVSLENDLITRIICQDRLLAVVAGRICSGAQLLTFLDNHPGDSLTFLDLDFGKGLQSGIDISTALRRRGDRGKLVFTTNHQELAMNVLKSGAEPFGFLEKGTDMKLLAAGMRRYIHMALRVDPEKTRREDTICLTVGGGETVEISRDEIVCLEAEKSVSHGITYHTVNGSRITVLGTLQKEAARLGDGFVRVHRSYLVAEKEILGLKDGYVLLSDQQQVPCALGMRAEVKRWLEKGRRLSVC